MPEKPLASATTGGTRRVCVIGAGSSGIAACQALHSRGIPFDCFEAGSSVGGNWRFNNDSGMSSAYHSLHAKSSRRGMQYAAFPIPDDHPDYLSHEMIAQYLDDYVDHFGFRGSIRFRTEVTRAEPAPGGGAARQNRPGQRGQVWAAQARSPTVVRPAGGVGQPAERAAPRADRHQARDRTVRAGPRLLP